jgi:hypothetical protein
MATDPGVSAQILAEDKGGEVAAVKMCRVGATTPSEAQAWGLVRTKAAAR